MRIGVLEPDEADREVGSDAVVEPYRTVDEEAHVDAEA